MYFSLTVNRVLVRNLWVPGTLGIVLIWTLVNIWSTIIGGGRYEKLVVLLFTDPIKNVGGAKGCFLSKLPKIGGAIAPPAPQVPLPLTMSFFHSHHNIFS